MSDKIFITGTSGIGKTTLANYIAKSMRIPFINGSSTVLWEQYGIRSHRELLEMGIRQPEKGLQFQYDLLNLREQLTKGVDSFVTDRTPVDNLVYFLYQNAPYLETKQVRDYIDACKYSFHRTTAYGKEGFKLIYLSRDFKGKDKMIIEDDGKRIDNPYYQDMMDGIFQQVLDKDYLKLNRDSYNFRKFTEYDWDTRLDITDNFIDHNRNGIQKFIRQWL
jgi:GTPase SAR1 family protein